MQKKEEKIASFQQEGTRLQLLKITTCPDYVQPEYPEYMVQVRYQVKLNRKVIDTSISEYQMRKLFASYTQNIVLQLKIY